jgi:hypothetical protein
VDTSLCLNRFTVCGEDHRLYLLREYIDGNYNVVQPHQGLANRPIGLPEPAEHGVDFAPDDVVCEHRLGGILKSYRWKQVAWIFDPSNPERVLRVYHYTLGPYAIMSNYKQSSCIRVNVLIIMVIKINNHRPWIAFTKLRHSVYVNSYMLHNSITYRV